MNFIVIRKKSTRGLTGDIGVKSFRPDGTPLFHEVFESKKALLTLFVPQF